LLLRLLLLLLIAVSAATVTNCYCTVAPAQFMPKVPFVFFEDR